MDFRLRNFRYPFAIYKRHRELEKSRERLSVVQLYSLMKGY